MEKIETIIISWECDHWTVFILRMNCCLDVNTCQMHFTTKMARQFGLTFHAVMHRSNELSFFIYSSHWQSNLFNFHTLSILIILSCRLRCRRQGSPLLSRYTYTRTASRHQMQQKMKKTRTTTPANEWKRTNLRLVVLTKQANHQRSFNDSRNGTLRLMCKSPSSASVLFFIHTDQHGALHY